MKNIPALMFLVIIFLLITVKNPAFTGENSDDLQISTGSLYGIMTGQILELVYPTDTAGELLSKLRWVVNPINYYGLQFKLDRYNLMNKWGLFTDISLLLGTQGDTGIMEDMDWQSVENGELTCYSSHKNSVNEFICMDVKAGFLLPLDSRVYFNPFLSFSWMMFSFTAKDGEAKRARVKNPLRSDYYPIDEDPEKYSFTGDVINYTQNWLIAAAGFIFSTRITPRLNLDFSFQISPLTFCSSVDEHIGSRTYYDFTGYGIFIEPAVNMSLNIKRFVFDFNLNYRHIGCTRGNSYIEMMSGNYYSSANEAGAGLSLLNVCFTIKARV
jgi:outer membrane protease